MSSALSGTIAGLVFGVVTVLLMLPMPFPNKTAALTAAFFNRFGIGIVIGCVSLAWPGWIVGVVFGLLLSLPDAIITKAYAPILIVGTIGGGVIGGLLHGWS
jgi:hypothetical protein